MGFGIILMVLFGLLIVGIAILIIGVLVLGVKRISKMSKPAETQIPAKADADSSHQSTSPQEISTPSSEKTIENPPQKQ